MKRQSGRPLRSERRPLAQRAPWPRPPRRPRRHVRRRKCRRSGAEDGQILLLALGYTLVAFALVTVAVDATAVHLARTQLLDAADAAALDAADAVDATTIYASGLGPDVPLSDAAVQAQTRGYLDSYQSPPRLEAVALTGATGSPDGTSAVVELTGRVRLPIAGPVVASFAGGITVTVRSTARAGLRP